MKLIKTKNEIKTIYLILQRLLIYAINVKINPATIMPIMALDEVDNNNINSIIVNIIRSKTDVKITPRWTKHTRKIGKTVSMICEKCEGSCVTEEILKKLLTPLSIVVPKSIWLLSIIVLNMKWG